MPQIAQVSTGFVCSCIMDSYRSNALKQNLNMSLQEIQPKKFLYSQNIWDNVQQ